MNKAFYPKLALSNLKKNSKTYIPYLLTCIGTIMMFYMMCAIGNNKGLDGVSGSEALKSILALGTVVIGIFSAIFLFYTNSFLVKRRKKEFGLYNILGMEKKHIAKMLFWETLFASIFSLIIGLIGGVIFSKLMFMLLLKLLNFSVPLAFSISIKAIISTIILFASIFLVALLFNLLQIRLAKPIELLHAGQHGEKEPKTKWIMTVIGVITLGIGYYMALTIESPLAAISLFFVAVILVMIGTYCLFTSGSIALLKILRKNKRYYYKTKHFTSVSGMIYRMKQNAVGLANICILSTAVLVTLSSTVSMYIGMEDILKTSFSRDFSIMSINPSDDKVKNIEKLLEEKSNKYNVTFENILKYRAISISHEITPGGERQDLSFITLDEYNRLADTSMTLESDEILMFSSREKYEKNTFSMGNKEYKIKVKLSKFPIVDDNRNNILNSYYIVANNEADIINNYRMISNEIQHMDYYYNFDIKGNSENIDNFAIESKEQVQLLGKTFVQSKQESRESFYAIYGTLFFLGLFLGALFLMATVLIIYYKQVSEGYDDKERFDIMQKVGMSKEEVKKSIRSQVLTVFFIPLITSVIHIAFAFKMLTKLLAVLNLTNVGLFVICTIATILVFCIIYGIVYALTARVYYKIVK
ncbi:MAG: ABC transporter permease [Oscillospiraceae bacterium]